MSLFTEFQPSRESSWRAIILFGGNVASYKFALAKSLLELAANEKVSITLEELAVPFSKHICEHLKHTEKQTTSQSSSFLTECLRFNKGEIFYDSLINTTVKNGFNYVLDAFHTVNRSPIPQKFYEVTKDNKQKSVILTDELFNIKNTMQFGNLPFEIEARWRLVETAWSLNINPKLIQVKHDIDDNLLFIVSPLTNSDGGILTANGVAA